MDKFRVFVYESNIKDSVYNTELFQLEKNVHYTRGNMVFIIF